MNPMPKRKQTKLKGDKLAQLKANVFHRDLYTCRKCHRWTASPHAHHIKLKQMGGGNREDTMENLITLCFICHRWAHDNPLLCKEWLNERKNSS